jgi:hypothetical protein
LALVVGQRLPLLLALNVPDEWCDEDHCEE